MAFRQHDSRSKIDGDALLEEIYRLTSYLVRGWAPEYPQPNIPELRAANAPPEAYRPINYVPIDKELLARLKGAIDCQLKLLNKVLPDLKAVDLTAVVGSQDLTLDDRELAQRAGFLLELNKRQKEVRLPLPPTLQ